jgi:hypothetical protein
MHRRHAELDQFKFGMAVVLALCLAAGLIVLIHLGAG